MKIEQTNAFKIDVEHFVKIAKEYQYISGREQTASEALQRIIKYRGAEYARKVAAKVNQKARYKFFIMED